MLKGKHYLSHETFVFGHNRKPFSVNSKNSERKSITSFGRNTIGVSLRNVLMLMAKVLIDSKFFAEISRFYRWHLCVHGDSFSIICDQKLEQIMF